MDDEQAALEIAYRSLAYKLRGNFNAWLGLQSLKSRETASDKVTTSTTTTTPEEIKSLLEVGFEYVCQKDDLVFLRKRK